VVPAIFLVRVLSSFLLFAATWWTAFLLARRLVDTTSPSLRLTSTLAVFLGLQHAGFEILTALHLFRPAAALAFWAGLALLVHRTCQGRLARNDLRRCWSDAFAALPPLLLSPVRGALLAWAIIAALARLAAGLVAPPLSWDTLTYHAFKPARWVHYGFQFQQLAPDQWRYLEFFPQAGEVPWAWAMLAGGNDALLPIAGFLVWAACGIAAYGLARSLGGQRIPSFYAGLITAFIPAIRVEMVTGYVDMFVLLAFLLMAIALVQMERRNSPGWAALTGVSLGLLGAAKLSGFAVAGIGFWGCTMIAWRLRSGSMKCRLGMNLAIVLAALLSMMAPGYLRTWLETGSPFYPLTFKVGKHVLVAGNSELFELYARKLTAAERTAASLSTLASALFIPASRPKHEYMGFGPGFLALFPLAVIALLVRLKQKRLPISTLVILLMVVLPVVYLLSDDFAAQRAVWYIVLGRLIGSLPAILAILAAQLRSRVVRAFLVATSAVGLSLAWPLGITGPVVAALNELLPAFGFSAVVALAVGLLVMGAHRTRLLVGWGTFTALAVFLTVFSIPWCDVRTKYRYPIFKAAASDNPAFVMHFVWDFHASAWPIWQHLDDGRPHRIDACYGWDGIGHNGLRYPLAGSSLQNEVLYVPITKDGEVIDYREEDRLTAGTDEKSWLSRLRNERIDYVVIGFPPPLELRFIEKNPAFFQREAVSEDGRHMAYRFKPVAPN